LTRVTNGDPRPVNNVEVVSKPLHQASFEIERIISNEDSGIWLALNFYRAVNVDERAAAGANVILSFLGFEVLIFEVVSYVAARESFRGLIVVLDVVSAQALAGVVDVDIVVGDEEITLAALRAVRREFGDTAPGNVRADLLRGGRSRAGKDQSERKQRHRRKELERGDFPSMRVAIHAEDAAKGVSRIA